MLRKLHLSKRRILYTICFLFFCLADQRIKTGSGLDGQIETFRALTGVAVALLILPQYHLDEMKRHRTLYFVWSMLGVIGGIFFVIRGQALVYFANERTAMALNVLLWGVILIHTVFELRDKGGQIAGSERRRPHTIFACLWLVMMGLMCVSRSEYHWPAYYLVMFACFYLTDYTEAEREDLFQGMLDGIILAFFLMQGWCFAFRPYDEVRYLGVYNNCNLNALFYLVVLSAALSKLLYVSSVADDTPADRLKRLFYRAGVGAVLGFLFLTISRTGWMTAVLLILVALWCLWKAAPAGSGLRAPIKNGVAFILCFLLLFPAVFGAVRYLPPLFHHPVWFFGEWSEEKVHSWDAWDSDKFVDLDELMGTANKRVAAILGSGKSSSATTKTESSEDKEPVIVSELQQQLYDETLTAGYAFAPGVKASPLQVRQAIYRYYIHLLNLTGHPESEQGFQMTATHRIGHAHNIYLQWGVDFGIPAMLLFMWLVIYTIVRLIRQFAAAHSVQDAGCLLLFLVPCIFGMLEYAWGAGSLTLTLIFVVWRRIIRNENEV